MKSRTAIFIGLLFICILSFAQSNSNSIIGSWKIESYKVIKLENNQAILNQKISEIENMILQKSIYQFNDNHTFVKPISSSIEYKYEIKENEIIISNSINSDIEVLKYTINNNQLIIKYPYHSSNNIIEITAIKL